MEIDRIIQNNWMHSCNRFPLKNNIIRQFPFSRTAEPLIWITPYWSAQFKLAIKSIKRLNNNSFGCLKKKTQLKTKFQRFMHWLIESTSHLTFILMGILNVERQGIRLLKKKTFIVCVTSACTSFFAQFYARYASRFESRRT